MGVDAASCLPLLILWITRLALLLKTRASWWDSCLGLGERLSLSGRASLLKGLNEDAKIQ